MCDLALLLLKEITLRLALGPSDGSQRFHAKAVKVHILTDSPIHRKKILKDNHSLYLHHIKTEDWMLFILLYTTQLLSANTILFKNPFIQVAATNRMWKSMIQLRAHSIYVEPNIEPPDVTKLMR